MEQIIIQDCGCIALPESVRVALNLKPGKMTLDVVLNDTGDAILLTPRHNSQMLEGVSLQAVPVASCVILPPSR
jgi:hypothetical protein